MHLVKWEEVIKPKAVGSLGLSNLEFKNWAILAKWWWRFGEEREALWRGIIVAKYGEDEWGWEPSRVRRSCVSGNIPRVGNLAYVGAEVFWRGVGFKAGEGEFSFGLKIGWWWWVPCSCSFLGCSGLWSTSGLVWDGEALGREMFLSEDPYVFPRSLSMSHWSVSVLMFLFARM